MRITTESELEEAAVKYGLLPFFRNDIRGFSVEEMTPPGLLFGGNEYEGCWEWKGPVIRRRTTAYGKFFRRKAGFVSHQLLPFFLRYRREAAPVVPGSTDEMILDIVEINDRMTSTDLRESLLGGRRKRGRWDIPDNDIVTVAGEGRRPSRHTLEGPLQRLQMGGRLFISDFRYKQTRRGERYGWGVAEYSTPESLFEREELSTGLSAEESLEYILEYVGRRVPGASAELLRKLLKP